MATKHTYDFRGMVNDSESWIVIPEFNVLPADVDGKGFDCYIRDSEIDKSIQEPIWNIIWFMRDKAKRRFASLSDVMVLFNRLHLGEKKFDAATEDEWYAYAYVCVFDILERWYRTHPQHKLDGSVLLAQLAEQILYMFSAGPHDPKSLGELRSQFAKKGAATMLAKSPKQQTKQLVRECWDAWQARPTAYEGKSAFARDMLSKYEDLKSQRVIERWCLAWEKEAEQY